MAIHPERLREKLNSLEQEIQAAKMYGNYALASKLTEKANKISKQLDESDR